MFLHWLICIALLTSVPELWTTSSVPSGVTTRRPSRAVILTPCILPRASMVSQQHLRLSGCRRTRWHFEPRLDVRICSRQCARDTSMFHNIWYSIRLTDHFPPTPTLVELMIGRSFRHVVIAYHGLNRLPARLLKYGDRRRTHATRCFRRQSDKSFERSSAWCV